MSFFGRLYRLSTFGESHSVATGCIIQGFPSNFKLDIGKIQAQLNRRRPGQSSISTPRNQADIVECLSGLQNGLTLGSPLCFIVKNNDTKPKDYSQFLNLPRPGHADYTYLMKYGIKAVSGGGRSSARQTIGRVIGGAVAKQFLQQKDINFSSWVHSVGNNSISQQTNKKLSKFYQRISNEEIQQKGKIWKNEKGDYFYKQDNNIYKICQNYRIQQSQQEFNSQRHSLIPNIRCPDPVTAIKIYQSITKIKQEGDSLGGIVQGAIYNLHKGLGEPVFDKLQAQMAHAMLSIPATKGFQFGSGFQGTKMKGSQHNDLFNKDLSLKTNNSGGTLGGISSGQTFNYKVAFKPVSTISKPQQTSNLQGQIVTLQAKGRHDPCVLPRAPPIVDNMAAIVIMDLFLLQNKRRGQ